MKRFMLTCICSGCFIFSTTVFAQNIITYSDDIVSFDYDSDFQAEIFRHDSGSTYSVPTNYQAAADFPEVADSSNGSFSIRVGSINEWSEKYQNWKDIVPTNPSDQDLYESVDVIADGELPESLVHVNSAEYGNYNFYRKLLGYNDDYFIIADYRLSDNDSEQDVFFKSLYDTVKVSDIFLNNEYSQPKDTEYTMIFSNVHYSDQVINYAKELIRIGQEYLDFSLSSDEAYTQLQEVLDRLSNYCESSESKFDSDISNIAYGIDVNILLKNDSKVLRTIEKLQEIVDKKQ